MTPKWEAAFYLRPCLVYLDFDLAESCRFVRTLGPDGLMRADSLEEGGSFHSRPLQADENAM